MEVGIIGGGGHVGLPTGLVLADAGFSVTLIDKDRERLNTIKNGEMPFTEEGGEEILTSVLDSGMLSTSTKLASVESCDVIIIVIGTPIDEHHNPEMDNLLNAIDGIVPHLSDNQLLLLRSTIYPGTTKIVRDRLIDAEFEVGEDIYLAFTPERVTQHRAIEEIISLPQLIGAFDESSFERAESLFESFLQAECYRMTPTEAELGKLFTNMWRYLTFAAANEFYLIADSFATHHDVNVHRILDQTSRNYPRFDVPSPGANVGGPCLTKDGWFLIDNIPYNELVSAAYQINEGMPAKIVESMTERSPNPEKIAILGMTFKADSDDTRNSVSFKLDKVLKRKGYDTVIKVEPNREEFDDLNGITDSDWVILMTPHQEFSDLSAIVDRVDPNCLFCDVWGFWEEFQYESDNGFFSAREVAVDSSITSKQ